MGITTIPNLLAYIPNADRDDFYKDVYGYISQREQTADKTQRYYQLYQCQSKTDVHVQMLYDLASEHKIVGLDFIRLELALLSAERWGLKEASHALSQVFDIINHAITHKNVAFFKQLGRYYQDDSLTIENISQHFAKQSCDNLHDICLDNAPNGAEALGYFFDHLHVLQNLVRYADQMQGLVAHLHYPV